MSETTTDRLVSVLTARGYQVACDVGDHDQPSSVTVYRNGTTVLVMLAPTLWKALTDAITHLNAVEGWS